MHDPEDPVPIWFFHAEIADRTIRSLACWMTLLPTPQRRQLLVRVAPPIQRLRQINAEWRAAPFVETSLDDLEAVLRSIANLRSGESRLDGQGSCPVCGSAITDPVRAGATPHCVTCDLCSCSVCGTAIDSHPEFYAAYCSPCMDPILEPLERLSSPEGFGTRAI